MKIQVKKLYIDGNLFIEVMLPFVLHCNTERKNVHTIWDTVSFPCIKNKRCLFTNNGRVADYVANTPKDIIVERVKEIYTDVEAKNIYYHPMTLIKRDGKTHSVPQGITVYMENAKPYLRKKKLEELKDL
jgi:hypothetical protein